MDILFLTLPVMAFLVIIVTTVAFFAARYKRCPSDMILVVYGKVGKGQSAMCIHGGAKLILPLLQDYRFMSLVPLTIGISLKDALSLQNIRINVPSTFTVGISTEPAIMNNAAERLLGLERKDVEHMAREIIFGQLRLTVASLTIEQINQDRERFLSAVRHNVSPELKKIGLYLINVNITDITDESNYIDSIGKKAAAEAINRAKVDVAEQEKVGAVGHSLATREKTVQVAANEAEAEKGKKKAEAGQRVYVQGQEAEAVAGENKAKAAIADSNAQLGVKQAEAMQISEVAKRQAEIEIQKAQYDAERERLTAAEIAAQEIEKRKIEIAAEAEAEKTRREAKGEADAILMKYEAEAKGIRQVLQRRWCWSWSKGRPSPQPRRDGLGHFYTFPQPQRFLGPFLASLPPPHQPILGVLDPARALEPTLREDPRRGVERRKRVRPNVTHLTAAERERDGCLGRFRSIPAALKHGHDAVGDLDHPILVWRPLEPDSPDDRTALPMDDGEAMNPRVCRHRGDSKSLEPSGRDLIRHDERSEAVRGRQAEAFLETVIPRDQPQEILG